jgi:hypothetical protein
MSSARFPRLQVPTVSAGFLVLAGAASAGAVDVAYDGSKTRIALAGDLRSFSETAPAAACHAGLTGDVVAHEAIGARVALVLAGLRDGSAQLGVPGPEGSGRLLRRLAEVEAAWDVLAPLLDAVAEGTIPADEIAPAQAALAEAAEMLLSDVMGEYGDPQEVLGADALRLNFLKRQRMLLGRIDRMACFLAAGAEGLGSSEEMAEAASTFETTLVALRDGMPAAGMAPPRHEAVADMIDESYRFWARERGAIDAVAGGAAPSREHVAMVTDRLSFDMANVATLSKVVMPGRLDSLHGPIEDFTMANLARIAADPVLVAGVMAQNAAHSALEPSEVLALDAAWQEGTSEGEALIDAVLAHPLSVVLAQAKARTGGLVTEIILMDDKGLNVALSTYTGDYWQGDEEKWQKTMPSTAPDIHIGAVELDDSTGLFQVEASMPVRDPATGATVGAIAYAFDIGRLF